MDNENVKSLFQKAVMGDHKALEDIYRNYRDEFLAFSTKFNVGEQEAKDVYQDAILVLIENIRKGKLVELKSSVKTYLFSIGKYMFYERGRKKGKVIYKEEVEGELEVGEMQISDPVILTTEQQLLQKYFHQLGKKCRQILTYFYYRGYDNDEIADALGYENKNVVKSQKSRCLRQIKDLIKKN